MLTPIGSHLNVIIQRPNHIVLYWRKNGCMIDEKVCPWSTLCADVVESTLFLIQSESLLQLKWAWSKLGNSQTCRIRGQDTRVSDSSCNSTGTLAPLTAFVNKMLTCIIWSHMLSNGTTCFLTHWGLVTHICVAIFTCYFPSDAFMRCWYQLPFPWSRIYALCQALRLSLVTHQCVTGCLPDFPGDSWMRTRGAVLISPVPHISVVKTAPIGLEIIICH